MIFTHPLNWPPGWDQTAYQIDGGFKVDLAQAERELADELERLGADSAYISTDNETSINNRPKASSGTYRPAAVLHFVRQNKEFQIPCDRFDSLRGNVRAIGYTLANIRQMERYGTSQMLDTALSGFAALPASATGGTPIIPERPWYDVFQVAYDAAPGLVEAAYKYALKQAHPDTGGSVEQFEEVQRAWTKYKEQANGR